MPPAVLVVMAPTRFSMARYCVGEPAARRPGATALVVVHDAEAPPEDAEHWTFGELDDAVRAVGAGLLGLGLPAGAHILDGTLWARDAHAVLNIGAYASWGAHPDPAGQHQ